MTLVDRILKELQTGPATNAELSAELPDVPYKSICGTTSNLFQQERIVVIRKLDFRRTRGGRKEAVYALPEHQADQPPPKPEKRAASHPDVIAGGEYAIAQRRTYAAYRWPSKANRGSVA